MKQGYRFVDCDMHIMEPPDLFDKYLDPAFKHRITSSMRRMRFRQWNGPMLFDRRAWMVHDGRSGLSFSRNDQ